MKKIIVVSMIVLMTLLSACSASALDNVGKELEDTFENAASADNKYVLMVKGGYRENNPSLTYEKAFLSFFTAPRWKYFKSEEGQDIVEFAGDCMYQDTAVKARIQFTVDEENGTFEASYLAFNEIPQDSLTLNALIEKTFEAAENTADIDEASMDKSNDKETPGVLSKAEAQDIVVKWLAEHRLGDCQSQDAEYIEDTSDGMYKYDIICNGSPSEYFIYINPENGLMSVEDYGHYYDSIEDWYSMVWLEEGIDSDGMDSEYASDTFDRSYYLYNSISVSDFMRYPDNNLNSPCYFEQYTVDNIAGDRVYVCRNGNDWIVIDDSAQSLSAKAMAGDMVTVYGVYNGSTSISFTDGSSLQVPIIKADKFIDNNVLPEDTESFLYGTIEGINRCEDAFGTGSEYLLDSYAKLAAGAEYSSDKSSLTNIVVSGFCAQGKAFIGYVDGYQVWIKTEWDNNITPPHELGIITFDDEEYGIQTVPVYIQGQFTNVDLNTSSTTGINTITLTFHIDSFEKYQ